MISTEAKIAIPPGSSWYYGLLFCSRAKREAANTVIRFDHEMKKIVNSGFEPAVAKIKLSWWLQEIDSIFSDRPQHPLGKSLMPVIQQYGLPAVWFQNIIQGKIKTLEMTHFTTFEELISFFQYRAGLTLLLNKIFANHPQETSPEFAVLLNQCIQLIEMIRNLGKDNRQGLMYFPMDDFKDYRDGTEAAPYHLCSHYAKNAREYYHQALAVLPIKQRYAQCSLIILAKILLSLLDEMERDNFAVLEHRYSLTPLRKLWIAWRTHFLERKYKQKIGTQYGINDITHI
ncbi:MAG: squalene/phytoene synthase family protein [Candidatus Berkiellales bacterium]